MCVPRPLRVPACTHSKQILVLCHIWLSSLKGLALWSTGEWSWEDRGVFPLSSPCQQQKVEPCSPFCETAMGSPSSLCIHFILTKQEAEKKKINGWTYIAGKVERDGGCKMQAPLLLVMLMLFPGFECCCRALSPLPQAPADLVWKSAGFSFLPVVSAQLLTNAPDLGSSPACHPIAPSLGLFQHQSWVGRLRELEHQCWWTLLAAGEHQPM